MVRRSRRSWLSPEENHRAGGTMTQSALRVLSVPQMPYACFSSSGPAWTRYHTPLSARSTFVGCMRRLASTSPCAACSLAQVDLATSSLLAEASWTRQPPAEPDMPSIRLAIEGPLSAAGAAVGAWVTVGAVGGGVGPGTGVGLAGVTLAFWIGVGVLASSLG